MALCLLPQPRRMCFDKESVAVSGGSIILPDSPSREMLFTARLLQAALRRYTGGSWDIRCDGTSAGMAIQLLQDQSICKRDAYQMLIGTDRVVLRGCGEAGIFYGAQTLIQIARQSGGRWLLGEVDDWPDFAHRGVMLDISRDKVPSMATLYALVDMLAEWKINQLQLYTEHTFAYSRHPEVWATCSPVTGEEILLLDAYCRERHIELVPNQNSFGHMERWLRLPRYIDLAEAPEGSDTPWDSRWDGPYGLCPGDPRSLELLDGLYAELLPHFASRMFNIGCDEAFDLGQGRSKAAVEQSSKTRVYLDFLLKLHKLVQRRGRQMMFWGDIIVHQPELISELPKDLIALEWGYEADSPFDKNGAMFAAAGVPFYVCPGTSSWCTIAGRTDNCLGNNRSAAENGLKHGAIGYLNTDWGDHGHLQYLPISYLGFAAGAAYGWHLASNTDLDMAKALDLHAFADSAGVMGKLAMELGNVYQQVPLRGNGSRLFFLLADQKDNNAPGDITRRQFEAALAAIDSAMAGLSQSRMERPDAELIRREFANAADMLRHSARRGLWLLDRSAGNPRDLAADLRGIIGRHEELWLARNRAGGLVDSAGRLRKTLELYAQAVD